MKEIPIDLLNNYIFIKDIENETLSPSGLYVPKEKYNRFARVVHAPKDSKVKVNDVIIKPIGRTTPITLDGVTYDAIRTTLLFGRIKDDKSKDED